MRGRPVAIRWQEDDATLYKLYNQEKDSQHRKRLQALWLWRQGRLVKEVAQIVGVPVRTVQEWARRDRQGGVKGVREHRHGGHGGRKSRLTPEPEAALREQASQGMLATRKEVVVWVEQTFDVSYTNCGLWTGGFLIYKFLSRNQLSAIHDDFSKGNWYYSYWGMRWVFARLGIKKKVPRPISGQASAPVQEAWKKGVWRPS